MSREMITAQLRALMKSSIVLYAIAFGIAGMVPFILLPVLTRILTPEEFGRVTFMLMVAVLLGNTVGLGAHGYVSVRFFKESSTVFAQTLISCLTLVGLSYTVVAILMSVLLAAGHLQSYMPTTLWLFALFAGMAISVNSIYLATFQSSGRPVIYLLLRAVQGSVEIALCLFLLGWQMGLWARALSYPLAIGISALMGMIICFRIGLLSYPLPVPQLNGPLRFGLPTVPHILAGTVLGFSDRLMVSDILGQADLGIYMASSQIGLALMLMIEPVNKAFAPWLFARLSSNTDADKETVVRVTYFFFAALLFCAVVLLFLANYSFDLLVGSEFTAARVLLPWVTGGFVFQGFYYMVVNYLLFAERTGLLSLISVSSAIFALTVMYYGISYYGIMGAAIAFMAVNIVNFLAVFAAAQYLIPMPWLKRRPA